MKNNLIDFDLDSPMSKKVYKEFVNFVEEHNINSTYEPICYEVSWSGDFYNVNVLNLGVDKGEQL